MDPFWKSEGRKKFVKVNATIEFKIVISIILRQSIDGSG